MPRKSATDAKFALRVVVELHCVFVDIKNMIHVVLSTVRSGREVGECGAGHVQGQQDLSLMCCPRE